MAIMTERFVPARADWAESGTVALVLFTIYALSAPTMVALEDDSLFVLSSYFLGIEHPPGYPLFTLIGYLFSQLPFGSVAYRVHLASAFFGALSGGLAWLCARALLAGRLPAYAAALALGVCPVFWSQAIIAEVYTLNTFLFLLLVYLGLRACPPSMQPPVQMRVGALLAWMAFLFGLSLSNHWPLTLLVAPAFAVLLWPLRWEILRRMGLLMWLVVLGLAPYAWLVHRSWQALPISFYGPLETVTEIWFFLSRAGYADVDQSQSADWLDRVKFFRFLGGQFFLQFAVLGTVLAAAGCAAQWRMLGRRIAAFLTVAFLMSSVVLLLLLGFDYSSIAKHIFHVYPLPAYAVTALWMALGLSWLVQRYRLPTPGAVAVATAAVGLIFFTGLRTVGLADHTLGARYALTVLETLPQNAVVFARGEVDLGSLAYFHLIEGRRPDITLYQPNGLILGNRLIDPLHTSDSTKRRILREAIEQQTNPVVFTLGASTAHASRERWIYTEVDKSSSDPTRVTVDIPEPAVRFFESSVLTGEYDNAFAAFFQGQLRRRYAEVIARSLPRTTPPDERTARHLALLAEDFYGALGIAEGLMLNSEGYSVGAVVAHLERARDLMPSDVIKDEVARFFHLRGAVRVNLADERGAIEDFETSFSLWPVKNNPVVEPLNALYRKVGDTGKARALLERVERSKAWRP